MVEKKSEKKLTKKIDMAQHEYRFNVLGLSERVKRIIIRFLILLVPVILIIYWILKTQK